MTRSFTPTFMVNTVMRQMRRRFRGCKCDHGVAYDLDNLLVTDGVVNTRLRCTVCGYPVETSADLATGEITWSVDTEWVKETKANLCEDHKEWSHSHYNRVGGCYWGP